MKLNEIICSTAEKYLESLSDNYIDLIVTSPPYDNLRDYNGFAWDFEKIAYESYRVLKQGGVLVWVIGDKYTKGSKGLTSKRQAIYFVDCVGFRLHDEVLYAKPSTWIQQSNRYWQLRESCYVLSKNKPKSTSILQVSSTYKTERKVRTRRNINGSMSNASKYQKINDTRNMGNIWVINSGYNQTTKDKLAYKHPAMFPEELAKRHILSWSNEGDIVLDYFMGSGTTAKMALLNNRNYLDCDISQEYVDLANERLKLYAKADIGN